MSSATDDLSNLAAAVAPDFTVQREIGRGGMGVVYQALDVALDRPVAIKVLPSSLAQSNGVRDRFLREGRTAAKLSHHPNIVPIYRADEIDGMAFLVMGFVDGPALGERLAVEGTIAPAETVRILADVASALDYAHACGVIHRDVKPENVLLDRASGRALVTDFGIAQVVAATPLTQTGQVLGTAHYMSPEQVSGEPMDGRSDLYAVGVMGFRMLTGRLPFDNAVASAIMVAHVTRAAPSVRDLAPDVPAALADVIDRCLRKSPVDRFASGTALAAALAACDDDVRSGTVPAAPSATPPASYPLSATERDAVLELATRLQDATGVQPVVRPLPRRDQNATDPHDEQTATRGYPVAHVAAAAEEVGIDRKFIVRALIELGLANNHDRQPDLWDRAGLGPPRSTRGPTRRFLGFPTGLLQTLELDRPLGEQEWRRLVADLRETFDAMGEVRRYDGMREWINGNLKVHVKPTANGHRIRIRTQNGAARAWMGYGLSIIGIATATLVAAAGANGTTAGALMGSGFMGIVGLGMFGVGALRLPSWARQRRIQFDEVFARHVQASEQMAGAVEPPASQTAEKALGSGDGRRAVHLT